MLAPAMISLRKRTVDRSPSAFAARCLGLVMGALFLSTACGGTAERSAPSGSGGTSSGGASTGGANTGGASSGGASGGGTSSGGTSSGGASSGGASSGGAVGNGGSQIVGACLVDSDCVAVVDAAAPCFSPYCSPPLAASHFDVGRNDCLVPWAEREGELPADCAFSGDIGCAEGCALQPECVVPRCPSGVCTLEVHYEPSECESPDVVCAQLDATRRQALAAARSCNAAIDIAQCSGSAVIAQECGCDVVVNETKPERVAAARAARDAWEAAGCAPTVCAVDCAPITGGGCVPGALGDVCVAN